MGGKFIRAHLLPWLIRKYEPVYPVGYGPSLTQYVPARPSQSQIEKLWSRTSIPLDTVRTMGKEWADSWAKQDLAGALALTLLDSGAVKFCDHPDRDKGEHVYEAVIEVAVPQARNETTEGETRHG